MRSHATAMLLTLAGCDALFGLDHLSAEDARDAAADSVASDGSCLGTGMLGGLCTESAESVTLTSGIDTSSDQRCRTIAPDGGPELCVFEAGTITVSAYVAVTGERPLVLLATHSIDISAPLDASSKRGTRTGAGAQATCTGGAGTNGYSGAGGGAGGTFGYVGGSGGAGDAGGANPRPGGPATAVIPQVAVYGGCAGGDGGVVSGQAAAGGAGGGAIYMIAGERIQVTDTGMVNASGAGGGGGLTQNGGGGGGSGGFIALDAPDITLDGAVFARGGGGGGGGGASNNGSPGSDPTAATGTTPGGVAGTTGSSGGDGCGAPNGEAGGIVSSATSGGGGGGGACGRIRLYGTRSGPGVTNPAPS